MVSPARLLFAALSFQVPSKGLCAKASELAQQQATSARNGAFDDMMSPLGLLLESTIIRRASRRVQRVDKRPVGAMAKSANRRRVAEPAGRRASRSPSQQVAASASRRVSGPLR